MISVICTDRERPAVHEFFQLFKTPWMFWEPGGPCDVLVVTSAAAIPESFAARLVIAFGTTEMRDGPSLGVSPRSRMHDDLLEVGDFQLPLYTGTLTLAGNGTVLGRSAGSGAALIVECVTGSSPTIRCGYDLFSEVEFLLSAGQPRERAGTPTLDLHIALMRRWVVEAGITLWEIPPVPAGYRFLACLTHDVDFLGIRRHRLDRTLAGFLLRASLGSLHGFIRGRRSLGQLLKNWAALLSLPFVYARVLPDFWLPFDRYVDTDGEFRSTFFVVPFHGRPGRGPDRPSDPLRGVPYAAEEIRPWLPRLRSLGFEIGVHGIDAWSDRTAAADELGKVAELTGEADLGVRMHWLYFNESSFATLDHAGFVYDASIGYNDAVGFRAGTTQVFRPLPAERLLELPLHIQDSALFFPGRMNCTEREALDLCGRILDWTQDLGGVSTLSWHERSLVPERQWDGAYRWLLAQLRQRGAYVAPAREVVSWFSARRSVDLQGTEIQADRLRQLADRGSGAVALPALVLRIHGSHPDYDDAGAPRFIDIPVDVDSLSALLGVRNLRLGEHMGVSTAEAAEPIGVITGICFHGIGEPTPGLEPDPYEFFVRADLFLAVLDEVATWRGISLTFDDGYASDVEVALPALRERGLDATFFPVAGKLGQPGYLDAAGVRALSAAGMTVGSHGMTHRSWRDLDARAEDEELTVARALIASAAQAPVRAAACPFGSYDRRALGALRRHGYEQVFTSDRRRARAGAWLQPRYSILRSDTLDTIRENILAPRPVAERLRCAAVARIKAWR